MPVKLYLHDLCRIDGTAAYWPQQFREFCDLIEQCVEGPKLEGDDSHLPTQTLFVLADWCKENDEKWMERAARFLAKRPSIQFGRGVRYEWQKDWEFRPRTLPREWDSVEYDECKTFAALLAVLACEIKRRMEEFEAEFAE